MSKMEFSWRKYPKLISRQQPWQPWKATALESRKRQIRRCRATYTSAPIAKRSARALRLCRSNLLSSRYLILRLENLHQYQSDSNKTPGCRPPHRHSKAVNIESPISQSTLNPSTGLSHHPSSFHLCSQPCHLTHQGAQLLSHPSYILAAGRRIFRTLLRRHVPPDSITNVDFSHQAIQLGIQREPEEFTDVRAGDGTGSMSWVRADLLDWSSIQANFGVLHGDSKPLFNDYRELDYGDSMPSEAWARSRMFSIVIEKSCADAIACGEDISIPVPYKLNRIVDQANATDDDTMYIHPVCLLAIHLAAMTKPAGFWIALSYSETRFDCLAGGRAGDQYSCSSKKVDNEPDPSQLWTVTSRQEIIFQAARNDGNVYRPKIAHWLYILRRTDVAMV